MRALLLSLDRGARGDETPCSGALSDALLEGGSRTSWTRPRSSSGAGATRSGGDGGPLSQGHAEPRDRPPCCHHACVGMGSHHGSGHPQTPTGSSPPPHQIGRRPRPWTGEVEGSPRPLSHSFRLAALPAAGEASRSARRALLPPPRVLGCPALAPPALLHRVTGKSTTCSKLGAKLA